MIIVTMDSVCDSRTDKQIIEIRVCNVRISVLYIWAKIMSMYRSCRLGVSNGRFICRVKLAVTSTVERISKHVNKIMVIKAWSKRGVLCC